MREAGIPQPLEEIKRNYMKSPKGNNVRIKKKKRLKGGYDDNINTKQTGSSGVNTI